ncbi:3'-5' exoribonuclease 1 [Dinochytrium kinnereticum]|nr:3'-5' exoribonuclease 1 [Dinochytrium kinnereticum]
MNRKTVQELRESLAALEVSTKGTKDQLKKRLRMALKREEDLAAGRARLPEPEEERDPSWQPFDFYLVFDVEATCQENNRLFHNEIIEFPIVLIDGRSKQKIDEFHRYVRPTLHPTLSDYCTNLTGITQETVDKASTFPDVLEEFEDWLSDYSAYPFRNCVFVTDGPWDIRDFIPKQLEASGIPRPPYFAKRYINLRRLYENFYIKRARSQPSLHLSSPLDVNPSSSSSSTTTTTTTPSHSHASMMMMTMADGDPFSFTTASSEATSSGGALSRGVVVPNTRGERINLVGMLSGLGMEFEGREHSGIDDARNIGRIAIRLMGDGAYFGFHGASTSRHLQ